jgi:predicted RNA-binding Zn ribbon-like protein
VIANASAAPNGLDLVIDFVNTLDVDADQDELHSKGALDAWLAGRSLTGYPPPPSSDADHRHAIALREALRELMLANNGLVADGQAGRVLETTARRGGLGVHFAIDSSVTLAAADSGVDGALARLLVPVAQAIGDGSWPRVKACRASDCTWAFYDRSRNRSGVWCDMAVCGNRTKVRAYRERAPRVRRQQS